MRTDLRHLTNKRLTILDGSTGTQLQKRGMPAGVCPEAYCVEHPEIIGQIQQEYLDAGSEIIFTPTFGANRIKLKHYGLEAEAAELNRRLAERTVALAHRHGALAAGDLGPTGLFFQPFGETGFETGLEIFREQAAALARAGADLLVIETQLDIQEARIALLAALEAANLPVIVSMTFDEQGKTLTGSDPLTCLNILQSLGAAAFGVNCSTGPGPIVEIIRALAPDAKIPLLAKPNAGLPVLRGAESVFPMEPEEFAGYAEAFWEAGTSLLGGCCGTSPAHIRGLAGRLRGREPNLPCPGEERLLLSGPRKTIALSADSSEPLRLIGERINPTGKKKLQADLLAGNLEMAMDAGREQAEQGADLLDVNLGLNGLDETASMIRLVGQLSLQVQTPLVIDSSRPEVIEAAVRFYPGRALVNSLSGERAKLEALIPVLAKYGSAFIVLPLDDRGIPETLEERQVILGRIFSACEVQGLSRTSAVVDGLALTVASNPAHARVSLQTLQWASRNLKLNTVLGLSNISFGLPGRSFINGAFLAMAAAEGLSAVIANPGDEWTGPLLAGAQVLIGRDPESRRFIARMQGGRPGKIAGPEDAKAAEADPRRRLRQVVLQGEKARLGKALQEALDRGITAAEIAQDILIPAIQEVGVKFEKREFFLPQLVAAAEVMEEGMRLLEPRLEKATRGRKGRVLLATVKGDVHDIGKKIVGLMLRNHGYEIVDLGKSVDAEEIAAAAVEHGADLVGLSALMTTTMTEMKPVIERIRGLKLPIKVMVGGAVVTAAFAREIGADGFAPDAVKAVEVLETLIGRP